MTGGAPVGEDLAAEYWEGEPLEHWRHAWGAPALHIFKRVGSTNDVARRLADAGAPAGTVVLTDEQPAGRGQHGRQWHVAPGKALPVSIVLRPRPAVGAGVSPAVVPLRVGMAVARGIERLTGLAVGLKWPNDLHLSGRKLGGILCEGALSFHDGGFIIAGIGVNVSQRPEDWPEDVRAHATSLEMVTGGGLSRAAVAGAIIPEVLALGLPAALPLSADEVRSFASRDVLRGREVGLDGEPAGTVLGVDASGALLLRSATGVIRTVRAGTVRPIGTAAARHPDPTS